MAYALNKDGFENHANRLLKQERLKKTYQIWRYTLNELEKVNPDLREGTKLYIYDLRIQLDVGGYKTGDPYSASIILTEIPYKNDSRIFEIRPRFGWRVLSQCGHSDDNIRWESLEKLLSIGQAVRMRDKEKLDRILKSLAA